MDFIVAVGWGSRSEEAREVVTTMPRRRREANDRGRQWQFRAWESRNCISTSNGTSVLTKLQLHQDRWRPIVNGIHLYKLFSADKCAVKSDHAVSLAGGTYLNRLLLVLPYGVHHLPIQKDRQSTTITAYLSRVSSRVLLGNLRLIVIAHSSLFPFFPFSKLYLGLQLRLLTVSQRCGGLCLACFFPR